MIVQTCYIPCSRTINIQVQYLRRGKTYYYVPWSLFGTNRMQRYITPYLVWHSLALYSIQFKSYLVGVSYVPIRYLVLPHTYLEYNIHTMTAVPKVHDIQNKEKSPRYQVLYQCTVGS